MPAQHIAKGDTGGLLGCWGAAGAESGEATSGRVQASETNSIGLLVGTEQGKWKEMHEVATVQP